MAKNANTFGFLEQEPGKDVDIPLPGRERLYAKPEYDEGRDYSNAQGLFYRKDDGEVVGPLIGWGYPVLVTSDWTLETNVMNDITKATGMLTPSGQAMGLDIYLWEGPDDPDDYASIVAGGNGALQCPWVSAPPIGATAYIIGSYVYCAPV